MKVLCTGSAGFIGSNVADGLIKEGYEVVIVDDLSTGFKENVNPKATFYENDIRDVKKMEEIFDKEKPDYVIHHAAQMDVRRSTKEPTFDAEVNIIGSLNIIINAVKHNIKKFVYVSTGGAVYGEPQYIPADENHPINPLCQYGISKHTVEHYLWLYNKNHGLQYIVLRYPNVYGPRQNPHGEAGVNAIFIGNLLEGKQCTIFGDGSKTRDYVYVGDVVRANLLAIKSDFNGIVNLGSGKQTSDQEVYDTIKKAIGSDLNPIYADVREGEIMHSELDASKAKKVLDWEPKVSFEEGVNKTMEYIKKNIN